MGKSIYFNWWKKLFYLTENLMPFYFLRWVRDYQGIRAQVLLERYSWHILHCIYRCIWHESITVCNWVIRGQTGLHMLLWLERRERKKFFFFFYREIAIFMNLQRRGMVLTDEILEALHMANSIWLILESVGPTGRLLSTFSIL